MRLKNGRTEGRQGVVRGQRKREYELRCFVPPLNPGGAGVRGYPETFFGSNDTRGVLETRVFYLNYLFLIII